MHTIFEVFIEFEYNYCLTSCFVFLALAAWYLTYPDFWMEPQLADLDGGILTTDRQGVVPPSKSFR